MSDQKNDKSPIYLEGPVSMFELVSKKYDKHVWILGDIHVNESTCTKLSDKISVSRLIEDTLTNNQDKVIDIFLEHDFINRSSSSLSTHNYNFLSEISNHFSKCLQVQKESCAFKNARFHYSDVRQAPFPDIKQIKDLNYMLNFLWLNKKSAVYEYYNSFLDSGKLNPEKLKILKELKIDRQIDNITDVSVKNKLWNAVNRCLDPFISNTKLIISKYLPIVRAYLKENITVDDLDDINFTDYFNWSDQFSCVMDYYLLGRMFRNFRNENIPTKYFAPAKYIIIYVGNWHAKKYYKILTEFLDFEVRTYLESNNPGKNFQCIDISESLPLFKEHRDVSGFTKPETETFSEWKNIIRLDRIGTRRVKEYLPEVE